MAEVVIKSTDAGEQKALRVAVLGPKGQCGSCIVDELLSRGHTVVGISRAPPTKWKTKGNYSSVSANFNDSKQLSKAMSDKFDAIVCAYGPPLTDMSLIYFRCVETHSKIKAALLASSHKGPFVIVGGGGSLHQKDGSFCTEDRDFMYKLWYVWPDRHLNYMFARAKDHGLGAFAYWIKSFKLARNNIEHPGWFSWIARPFARLFMRNAKKWMAKLEINALILGSRVAYLMWEGVTVKSWSFLSPPWYLRDKGIRTGKYQAFIDTPETPAQVAIENGIYNEDMAVAIADEVESNKLAYKHWTCIGQIDLKEW